MTMFLAPYTAIADIDGSPLDAGFLFFGEYGKDPELFPVEVFWDADFTVPAAQPIRTRNGYPVRNGSPTKVYLKTAQHSVVIKNRNGAFILVDFKNKGWSANFVVDASGKNQQQVNDELNQATLKLAEHVAVYPKDFGASGDGVTDDKQALIDADVFATENGLVLDGQGLTYAVSSKVTLECANFKNIKIVPTSGNTGDGVDFVINQSSNSIYLDKVLANGFKGYGAMILKGSISSSSKSLLIAQDCDFSANGNLVRSVLTVAADGNSKTQTVADASIFSVGQYIWISDCRVKIASVSGNVLTMVSSDGVYADILEGSSTANPVGQYVTVNNAGRNGLQIGGHREDEFDIYLNRVAANDCGWFGIYNRIAVDPTTNTIFHARSCETHRCGYLGMGAGRTYIADIEGCFADENSNNGIDSNATLAPSFFRKNTCLRNGADGLFISPLAGYNNPVTIDDNNLCYNLRIGCLFSGGNDNNIITNNTMIGNLRRNLGSRGVHSGEVTGNTFDGASDYHVYIEGRDGYANPSGWNIHHNTFKSEANIQDIFANIGGYSGGGANGKIEIKYNNYAVSLPKIEVIRYDTSLSKSYPETYFTMIGNKTSDVVKSVLKINFQAKNPFRTSQNLNISKKVEFSAYSSYPATPTRAIACTWSNRTAGMLLNDNLNTYGYAEIVFGTSGAAGIDIDYNTTAKRVYVAKVDEVEQYIEMEWI
ncbi:hypothetical protein [Acinetobacter wanghuae]|uniref:hypothetical protein n=1 Tax=Acinetobacter wanghuae TaxID=2662362 RepID=UPI00148F2F22|nr:hypothetical protein [Acinetobacter wanghuae]